jgi:hypothetical protein
MLVGSVFVVLFFVIEVFGIRAMRPFSYGLLTIILSFFAVSQSPSISYQFISTLYHILLWSLMRIQIVN